MDCPETNDLSSVIIITSLKHFFFLSVSLKFHNHLLLHVRTIFNFRFAATPHCTFHTDILILYLLTYKRYNKYEYTFFGFKFVMLVKVQRQLDICVSPNKKYIIISFIVLPLNVHWTENASIYSCIVYGKVLFCYWLVLSAIFPL